MAWFALFVWLLGTPLFIWFGWMLHKIQNTKWSDQ